ncbi:TPA: hypothetical protein ACH3X1_002968 [Trebouxia sp. C0004]
MLEDFEDLRVVDLKEECKKRNLLVGGKKAELIERLKQFEASKADGIDEEAKGTIEASEKDATLRPGFPKEVETAAEDIVESGANPVDEDTGKVSDNAMQDTAGPAGAEPVTADSPKASSKSQHSSPSAAGKQVAEHSVGSAGKTDKAAQDSTTESSPAASTRKSRQAKAHKETAEGPMAAEESGAEQTSSLPASEPALEAEAPATAAPTRTDAPMLPETDETEAASDAAAATSQPQIPDMGSAQDDAAPVAMDVEPARKASTPRMPDVSEPEAALTTAVNKAANETSSLAAAETDASKAKAATAAEDVEMVQYDEPSNDTELAAAKQQGKFESKASDGKPSESSRSHRDRHVSTGKAAKDESAPHGSVRKREREVDESARVDRKAPRTDHKSASQKEKEREKAKDKDKEREKTQANGSGPTERKRKHAPISYKPPERHTSGAEQDKVGTDTAKREAVFDNKGSGADALPKQKSGLEGRQSGLDPSVSRTQSGHKLSVFERLQRSKGEGSGTPALPPTRDLPTPISDVPAAPLPRTTSHSRRNQPTRALKIEGFVRPFTEPAARAMLSETGEIVSMWMPKIKTHAFVIYTTQGQAEATLNATHGLNWPKNNPSSKLAAKFVPLEEAETAIARANGASVLTAATAPLADGLPLSRDSSAAQEGHGTANIAPQRGRADLDESRRSKEALDDRRRPREDDRRRVKERAAPRIPEAIPEPLVSNRALAA